MHWSETSNALCTATVAAAHELLSAVGEQSLYSLALYMSDDAMNVSFAANTEAGFKAVMEAEAQRGDMAPEEEAFNRWASTEWAFEGWGAHHFSKVNALIGKENTEDFERHFSALIEAMTLALIGAKEALGERLANVTAFVTLTDSENSEEIENTSAVRINSPEIATAFLARYG